MRAFGQELGEARRCLRDRIGAGDADDVKAELTRGANELRLERQKSRLV